MVEALRSIQIRRQSGDKESASGRAASAAPLDTLKATRQERFSRQSKTQNSAIAQTTPALKREKSFLRTPDTLGSNTPGNKSKKDGLGCKRHCIPAPSFSQLSEKGTTVTF